VKPEMLTFLMSSKVSFEDISSCCPTCQPNMANMLPPLIFFLSRHMLCHVVDCRHVVR
jgi:hypothetical protein